MWGSRGSGRPGSDFTNIVERRSAFGTQILQQTWPSHFIFSNKPSHSLHDIFKTTTATVWKKNTRNDDMTFGSFQKKTKESTVQSFLDDGKGSGHVFITFRRQKWCHGANFNGKTVTAFIKSVCIYYKNWTAYASKSHTKLPLMQKQTYYTIHINLTLLLLI